MNEFIDYTASRRTRISQQQKIVDHHIRHCHQQKVQDRVQGSLPSLWWIKSVSECLLDTLAIGHSHHRHYHKIDQPPAVFKDKCFHPVYFLSFFNMVSSFSIHFLTGPWAGQSIPGQEVTEDTLRQTYLGLKWRTDTTSRASFSVILNCTWQHTNTMCITSGF